MEKEVFEVKYMRSLDAKGLADLKLSLRTALMKLRMDVYKDKNVFVQESRKLKKALARLLTISSQK